MKNLSDSVRSQPGCQTLKLGQPKKKLNSFGQPIKRSFQWSTRCTQFFYLND